MGHVERRKRETRVQFLWHLSDVVAISAAFLLGYWLRFHSPLVGLLWNPGKGIPPLLHYLVAAGTTAVVWIVVFHTFGLYRLRGRWEGEAVSRLLRASLFGMVLTAGLAFFYRDVTLSRIAVPLIWMLALPLLHWGRLGALQLGTLLDRRPPVRFLVIGLTLQGLRIARALARGRGVPHAPVGFLLGPGEGTETENAGEFQVLGRFADVGEVVAAERIDRVIVALPLAGQEALFEILRQCRSLDVDIEFVPGVLSVISQGARFGEIEGVPIVSLREIPLSGWNGVVKRTFDLVVTVPLLILLSPLMLVTALLIRLDSPGPVFYRQERVGRDRTVLQMLKFRSMRVDAERGSGPVWAGEGDPRRTRLGGFLRTWSLDELPQLINVLKGEMSLVGPRPERPYFVDRFQELVPGYFDRHRVKSGITGWAQVNGLRGSVPIEERTRYDLQYITDWSLGLDLRILVMTLRSIFAQRGQ
ncbi:MAG: undecaprenyl-phosphate glucose phosphotransferase [Candidatus Eisenbacteria sp.]|nr:undecaprenyl-phosphate glucose phosphotransferase [Candidatus Eisenbacteria bacterium]